jgi:hypothetical protein
MQIIDMDDSIQYWRFSVHSDCGQIRGALHPTIDPLVGTRAKYSKLFILFVGSDRRKLLSLGLNPHPFGTSDQLASDSYEPSGAQTLRLLSVTSLRWTRLATDYRLVTSQYCLFYIARWGMLLICLSFLITSIGHSLCTAFVSVASSSLPSTKRKISRIMLLLYPFSESPTSK